MVRESSLNSHQLYMDEIPQNTGEIRDELGRFLPGISGNPAGKPKGATSITAAIRGFLESNPDKFHEIMMDYLEDKEHRKLLWQMLDGMPKQNHDVDFGFKPIPLDPNVYKDESISEDQIIETEN